MEIFGKKVDGDIVVYWIELGDLENVEICKYEIPEANIHYNPDEKSLRVTGPEKLGRDEPLDLIISMTGPNEFSHKCDFYSDGEEQELRPWPIQRYVNDEGMLFRYEEEGFILEAIIH